MITNEKINWRWLLVGFLIGCILFLILVKAKRAEAADVSRLGKAYRHIISNEKLDSMPYYFISGDVFLFSDAPIAFTNTAYTQYPDYPYMATGSYKFYRYNFSSETYACENKVLIVPENFTSGTYFNYSLYLNAKLHAHAQKLEDPSLVVNITIDGVTYTVSEYYKYYLGLRYSDGSIRLLFSDTAFTSGMIDLYNREYKVNGSGRYVQYYCGPGAGSTFVNSRSERIGPATFILGPNNDHICNYYIFDSGDLLDVWSPAKESFNTNEVLTSKDLFSVMPDELLNYNYCIVFRQDSLQAYDDRIIFYGWNETNANLYIMRNNSQIAALTNKSVVTDYITAYYDLAINKWVVSDDVILGATKDHSYNLPIIYHSDVNLLVCEDEWRIWDSVGYMGDSNRPIVSFEEPDEDDGILSRIFKGMEKLMQNLFVPSSGFLNSKVAYMKSKFVFYESICDTINVVVDFFKETDYSEPPKFYIDLSKSRSKYDYGDKAVCLDMSWYEEYKPAGDAFISAVLWLVFAWNTFRNLPNIIAGIGAGGNVTTSIIKASQPSEPQASAISKNAMKEGRNYTRGL